MRVFREQEPWWGFSYFHVAQTRARTSGETPPLRAPPLPRAARRESTPSRLRFRPPPPRRPVAVTIAAEVEKSTPRAIFRRNDWLRLTANPDQPPPPHCAPRDFFRRYKPKYRTAYSSSGSGGAVRSPRSRLYNGGRPSVYYTRVTANPSSVETRAAVIVAKLNYHYIRCAAVENFSSSSSSSRSCRFAPRFGIFSGATRVSSNFSGGGGSTKVKPSCSPFKRFIFIIVISRSKY